MPENFSDNIRYGHSFYDFPLVRVAEFLDVEVLHTLSPVEILEMQPLLANCLAEIDCLSPHDIDQRKKESAAAPARRNTGGGGRRTQPPVQELSEQQRMMAALREGMVLSHINPLQKEITDYVEKVSSIAPGERDTFGFWTENELLFPILAKVARISLCVSATSCDVE